MIGELIGAGIGLAGSLFGASKGNAGADDAAKTAKEALAYNKDLYTEGVTRAGQKYKKLLKPYNQAGLSALSSLQKAGGEESPLLQWELDRGTQALNKSLAARGLLNSGAGLELISNFTKNTLDTDYARRIGINTGLAGMGMQATEQNRLWYPNAAQYSSINMSGAGGLSSLQYAQGANQGNMYAAAGSALGTAIGSINWGGMSGGGGNVNNWSNGDFVDNPAGLRGW